MNSSTPAAVDMTSTSRLYRTAGVGAVVAGVAFILQPIFVFLLAPDNDGSTVEKIEALRWSTPFEVIVFSAIGVSMLFLVVATYRLMTRGGATVGAGVAALFGVLSAFGWFGASAGLLETQGLGLDNMTAAITDPQLQAVWIQGQTFSANVLWLVLIGATGWFVGLATAGRRARVIGLPLTIIAIGSALVIAVPAVVFFLPFGILVLIPSLIAIGVSFLLKSRAGV